MNRGFGLDWILATQSIPYTGLGIIAQNLENGEIKVAITTGRKSGEILKIKKKKSGDINAPSVVYQISCGGCHKIYVGETGGGVKTRLAEHKRLT